MNTSPATLDEKDALKKYLTDPPVKKIDLHFPLGLEVTARNLKGVTIKDALDAIHKQFKKKVSFFILSPRLTRWSIPFRPMVVPSMGVSLPITASGSQCLLLPNFESKNFADVI